MLSVMLNFAIGSSAVEAQAGTNVAGYRLTWARCITLTRSHECKHRRLCNVHVRQANQREENATYRHKEEL